MNTGKLPLCLLLICMLFHSTESFSQLELKLEYISDNTWGVFARPGASMDPSNSTTTGSGQVTVVMPSDFIWYGPQSFSGSWTNNALVADPVENPGRQYVSFGLVASEPTFPVGYKSGEETLLFTFKSNGDCPDFLYLIDCKTPDVSDPFCPDFPDSTPGTNSQGSNPGNDLSVVDFGFSPPAFYYFSNNYDPEAWKCNHYITVPPFHSTGDEASIPSGQMSLLNIPVEEQPGFTVFPNPATDHISLNLHHLEEESHPIVRLYNLQGTLLFEQFPLGNQQYHISLAQWPSGMYLLTLESGGQIVQRSKVVKR